jgi:hypothetical protein
MELDDSESSGSGWSPKTAASAGHDDVKEIRTDSDWPTHPLAGQLSNTLELFDPSSDDMAAFKPAFPAMADSAYAFEAFGDFNSALPQSSALDATSDAILGSL